MSTNSKIPTKLPPGVSIPQKTKRTPSPELLAELREELKAELKAELRAELSREAGEELKAELKSGARTKSQSEFSPQPQAKTGNSKEAAAQTARAEKEQLTFKESFFSAKLRQQEEARKRGEPVKRKPAGNISSVNELMMEDMWKEMEAQISYSVPKGKALPQDFLQSIGMSGEQVLISPKAIAILKKMMEDS